jgi:hypothetical protein
MLKAISELICCKTCKQILKKPVIIPCGETICAEHETLFRNEETVRCQFCDKDHELADPEQHFLPNKGIEGFLAGEISKLDLGEKYKRIAKLLEEMSDQVRRFDELKERPESLIFEKFQEMRRKVDLVREEIIQ